MSGISFYPQILDQASISPNVTASILNQDPILTEDSTFSQAPTREELARRIEELSLRITELLFKFWKTNTTSTDTPGSSENILTCLCDAFSSSWWLMPIKVLFCARYINVEGLKDVAKLIAGLAFMHFLLYRIKRPETDAYITTNTYMVASANMLALRPALQEAVSERPVIQYDLLTAGSNDRFSDDDVLIEAGTFGPEQEAVYVPRQMYNDFADKYNFQRAL